jgi:outer membrane protein OmpA-like peptidoglycan-associated protein
MSAYTPAKRKKTNKSTNRRRNGYELTQQRDMMPVALGAAVAALVVHIIAYIFAPSIFSYALKPIDELADKVKDDTKRVVFKVREDEPEEIHEEETPEPAEIEPPEPTPQDVDLLETDLKELELRPGDTQLFIAAENNMETESLKPLTETPPAEIDLAHVEVPSVPTPELIENPDPVPMNANDVVINTPPQIGEVPREGDTLEAELKDVARDSKHTLPADTRSLSELIGESNLSSQSGVARLGADVLFDFNECSLKRSALVSLQQLAALIQINRNTHFIIEGHSDSIGTATYNAFISLQRAAAVREWLRENGVPVEKVYIRACANKSPIVPITGKQEEEKLNRRVEIHMRSASEELPPGCLTQDKKVPLNKSVTQLLREKLTTPKTYPSASKLRMEDDEDAEEATE